MMKYLNKRMRTMKIEVIRPSVYELDKKLEYRLNKTKDALNLDAKNYENKNLNCLSAPIEFAKQIKDIDNKYIKIEYFGNNLQPHVCYIASKKHHIDLCAKKNLLNQIEKQSDYINDFDFAKRMEEISLEDHLSIRDHFLIKLIKTPSMLLAEGRKTYQLKKNIRDLKKVISICKNNVLILRKKYSDIVVPTIGVLKYQGIDFKLNNLLDENAIKDINDKEKLIFGKKLIKDSLRNENNTDKKDKRVNVKILLKRSFLVSKAASNAENKNDQQIENDKSILSV